MMQLAKKTLHVGVFVHAYPPARGGVEHLSQEIATVLRQHDHMVTVFTGQGKNLDSYKTFEMLPTHHDAAWVRRLPLKKTQQCIANILLRPLLRFRSKVAPQYFGPMLNYREEDLQSIAQLDVIVALGFPTQIVIDAWQFAKTYGKPLVVLPAFHDSPLYLKNPDLQAVLHDAQNILCLSQKEKQSLAGAYVVEKKKVRIVSYSPYTVHEIEAARVKYAERRWKKKRQITLGYVGQLSTRKNLKFFGELYVALLPLLAARKQTLKIVLAGIATQTTPEVEGVLRAVIPDDCLELIHDPAQLKQVYQKLDVFVHPSTEESYGIVNIEAMSAGLPILVQKASPFGTMAPVGTFESVAQAADFILKLTANPSRQKQIVARQFAYLLEHSREKFEQQILEMVSTFQNG